MIPMTTVTTKGQVTIPEAVREALGIMIGDKVVFTHSIPHKREMTLRIIPTTSVVDSLYGSIKSTVHEPNHAKARLAAGKLLAKKYHLKP